MRRRVVITLICLAYGALMAVSGNPAHSTTSNLSKIKSRPSGRTQTKAGISECFGLWRYQSSLSDIGLTDADLKKEVNCIVADLDDNGTLDFVIWGSLEPSKQGLRGTRAFKVLFFDKSHLIQTQKVFHEDYDHAIIWPMGRGFEGACKMLPQKLDGVVLPGEGGGSWFYIYNPKLQRLTGQLACDE